MNLSGYCVLLVVLCSGMVQPAAGGDVSIRTRPTADAGLKLLQEGKIDEAARELGFGTFPGEKLLRLAREARTANRRTDALGFLEAYLQYIPADRTSDEWRGAAVEYIKLLAATDAPDEEWFRQSRTALSAYQALWTAHDRADAKRCFELADRIVTRYPQSIFCQSAALIAGRAVGGSRTQQGHVVYEALLARMKAAGIPERDRLFIMLAYDNSLSAGDGEPAERLSVADVLRLSGNPLFRRAYLLENARFALRTQKLNVAGELLAKFVKEFPETFHSEAHRQVVDTCLEEGHPDPALAWVRDRQRRHPRVDISVELCRIADHLRREGRPQEAVVCYREVIESSADSRDVPLATLGAALAYKSLGKEELMVAALRDLADKPPKDSGAAIMDARNRAHEELATYYMAKKNWAEALRSWQSWEPSLFCGFGHAARLEKKRQSIEYCVKQLAAQN